MTNFPFFRHPQTTDDACTKNNSEVLSFIKTTVQVKIKGEKCFPAFPCVRISKRQQQKRKSRHEGKKSTKNSRFDVLLGTEQGCSKEQQVKSRKICRSCITLAHQHMHMLWVEKWTASRACVSEKWGKNERSSEVNETYWNPSIKLELIPALFPSLSWLLFLSCIFFSRRLFCSARSCRGTRIFVAEKSAEKSENLSSTISHVFIGIWWIHIA